MDLQTLLSSALVAAARPRGQARRVAPATMWAETVETYTLDGYEAHVRRCACACGTVTLDLAGLYELRHHPRIPSTRLKHRIQSIDLVEGLPTATLILDESASACVHCIEQLGFAGLSEADFVAGAGQDAEEDAVLPSMPEGEPLDDEPDEEDDEPDEDEETDDDEVEDSLPA